MQDHSASERSVGYLFLIHARVANHYPSHPFRTVSEGEFSEVRSSKLSPFSQVPKAIGPVRSASDRLVNPATRGRSRRGTNAGVSRRRFGSTSAGSVPTPAQTWVPLRVVHGIVRFV
jgi:hypothetical protein